MFAQEVLANHQMAQTLQVLPDKPWQVISFLKEEIQGAGGEGPT